MSKLNGQTIWSVLPILAVTVVNIFTVPLFYRSLGPDMYALWFYVLTLSGSFGFMDIGLGVAVGRYIGVALGSEDREAVKSYWSTGNAIAIPLLVGMASVFVLLGIGFGPTWFNVSPNKIALLQWSFLVGGIGLFFSYYAQFWYILSQAHLDFKFLSIVRTSSSLFQVLPSVLIAWLTGNPLFLISWAAFIGALTLAVYIWHARKYYSLGFDFQHASWKRAKEMSSYTGKVFATLLVNSLLGSVDKLLLGKLATSADFAHFNIAANVGGRISGLSVAVMGPVFHNTSRGLGAKDQNSPASIYDETFQFMFGWYLLAAVWASIWSGPALSLWLGQELGMQIKPIFVPMILGYCITSISNISASQLSALNRIGTGLVFHILAGLLLAVGVWVGWNMGGVQGVAWGFLLSRVVLLAQDLYLARLLKAGGWFASETWLMIAGQICVAGCFYAGSKIFVTFPTAPLVFAFAHASAVTVWLLHQFRKNSYSPLQPSGSSV